MNMTSTGLLALAVSAVLLTTVVILGWLSSLAHRHDEGHCASGCGCLLLGVMGLVGLLLLIAAF